MARLVLFFMTLVLLTGCSRSPFKGYKRIGDDLYYRLNVIGEGDQVPAATDSVLIRVRASRMGDAPGSLYSTERWYGMTDSAGGFFHTVLGRLHIGDSASLITRASRIPWARLGANATLAVDTGWVTLELLFRDDLPLAEQQKLAEARRRSARTEQDEENDIARYLARKPGDWKEYMGVRYMLDERSLRGEVAKSGQLITMAYRARFLSNGKVFDDTHLSAVPLTFRLGDPEQVIKGLEIAAHLLPKGGKGTFLIPSGLAFGAQGSSSGIVPPHTPVLYEVELVDVADGATAPL